MSILITIYVVTALLLAMYGFNAWLLTALYFKNRKKLPNLNEPKPNQKRTSEGDFLPTELDSNWLGPRSLTSPKNGQAWPRVTVQLPTFNEALVVERLIDTVVQLDYPTHLLQIQVLDDSTDETTAIALARVEQYQRQGFDIELIHRSDRVGFKAGALKHGLEKATGQFIAIFDADFVPEPDFLKQTVPHFMANPQLGFVQARWGHLNYAYSHITAAQAIAIDGHFMIEQTARNRTGLLMNFNGTAGVWRRACIKAAGGWQQDTVCEDFDLSYRAQLAGWDCLFLPEVVVPAEIPPQLAAFKRQQFRWAKGSIQCFKKLGWQVLRASLSWPTKLQAFIHLSNYSVHLLIVILAIITPLLILTGGTDHIRFPLIYLSLASLGSPFLFAISQAVLYPTTWRRRYKMMSILVLLGSGIALSSTKAIIEAWLGVGGNIFHRTPKFNVVSATDRWQHSDYRLPLDGLVLGELAMSLYSLWGAWIAATNGHQFAVPFILFYASCFGYVGLRGLWDARSELRGWFVTRFSRQSQQTKASRQQSAYTLDRRGL